MKIALLGDIHGNAAALEAVLDAASGSGVQELLITGDLVGYYFEPSRVLGLLAPWSKHVVRGNHEDMLRQARMEPRVLYEIERKYGSGLRVAIEELSLDEQDWLCSLPHPTSIRIGGRSVLLCHGSPWDNDYYVYPDASGEILQRCAWPDADLVILGHTHYPMEFQLHGVRIVNPGSVGQPRNGKPGAQWALYDSDLDSLTLRSENYDYKPVVLESRRRHPEMPYLAEVLGRTR